MVNTCLAISEDFINIAISDPQDLDLSVSDSFDLSLSVADSIDLALQVADDIDLALTIQDPIILALVIQDPFDIKIVVKDITMIVALADEGEAEVAFSKRIDMIGDTLIYKGEAVPGTLDAAGAWRIRKIEFVAEDVVITWASGNENLDKVWDNRLSYIYS